MQTIRLSVPLAACLFSSLGSPPAAAQTAEMTFFVTSVGSGKGGDLGGLSGADAHCQQLAASIGAGNKAWRAYLSTQGDNAVNARDRIGNGPWQNAKGVVVATSVADLHSANNKLNKQNSLSEKGEVINGRGDKPNRHDILTGSHDDGTAFPAGEDRTCSNWTSSTKGAAMLGHHDRMGLPGDPRAGSWNAAHASREPRDGSAPGEGCSQTALRGTGGDGLIYCFAAN